MSGKPKTYPPELVELFRSMLQATRNLTAASRACGYSKALGRGMLDKYPDLRALVVAPWMQRQRYAPGVRATAEYRAWAAMRSRCNDVDSRDYAQWGGRGIRVCDRWDGFDAFLADVGPRPATAHSLDRVDNDGNYEPGNVRWATKTEQAENRRSPTFIEFAGERLTVSEWARRLRLPQSTLWNRLFERRWPVDKALTAR